MGFGLQGADGEIPLLLFWDTNLRSLSGRGTLLDG